MCNLGLQHQLLCSTDLLSLTDTDKQPRSTQIPSFSGTSFYDFVSSLWNFRSFRAGIQLHLKAIGYFFKHNCASWGRQNWAKNIVCIYLLARNVVFLRRYHHADSSAVWAILLPWLAGNWQEKGINTKPKNRNNQVNKTWIFGWYES